MFIIYNVIIGPIELLTRWIFTFMYSRIPGLGVIGAICGVSFVINFLALPLYNIADSLQAKERNIQKKLEYRTKRIKKAFTGDERFMILSEYYRQNNYHPLYVLRSALSILIEVPFFIAAYNFLSHCDALNGVSFTFLHDLGKPDAVFSIPFGSYIFTVNILPILMTVINLFSGAIYTKEAPLREKIQIYAMAALFLVILYNSPSGLVFYWILNNLFSLAKNIVVKMKHPRRIAFGVVAGVFLLGALFIFIKNLTGNRRMFRVSLLLGVAIIFALLPLIVSGLKKVYVAIFSKKVAINSEVSVQKTSVWLLLFSGVALTLIAGLVIPSSVIGSSPTEFCFLGKTDSPLAYINSSLSMFIGFFLFWPLCIYKMFGEKVKKYESLLFVFLLFVALANIYIFKYDMGNISVLFNVDNPQSLENNSFFYSILPVLVAIALIAVITIFYKKGWLKILSTLSLAICIASLSLGLAKVSKINNSYKSYKVVHDSNKIVHDNKDDTNDIIPVYHLSKTGNNVIFLFLDRALNSFWPYTMQEFPEMKEQFSGFVYYPNTISYSSHTVMGSPAMMAGYDYTPEAINARDSEKLVDKHNESMLVLPKIFLDAGYNVTVTDPPFSNYTWTGDLTPFDKYPKIQAKDITGLYTYKYKKSYPSDFRLKQYDEMCKLNIVAFSFLQFIPPIARKMLYQNGNYLLHSDPLGFTYDYDTFLGSYSSLYYLNELTTIENEGNNYIFIDNETNHEYKILKEDYTPGIVNANNVAPLKVYPYVKHPIEGGETDFVAYQVNVASFKQIGKWFDYLKANGVYDNTRIIITADHGRPIPLDKYRDWKRGVEYAAYLPLLMYKDFGASGSPKTDNTFMTNADSPYLLTKDLPVSQHNPFTGNLLKATNQKKMVDVHWCLEWNAEKLRDKNQFELNYNKAFKVHDDVNKEENWIPYEKKGE